MLKSQDELEFEQAAHLLGWLKNPRAAQQLLAASRRGRGNIAVINRVIEQHYQGYRFD
jgi:hypothetical protein